MLMYEEEHTEIGWGYIAVEDEELGEATGKFEISGNQKAPTTQWKGH